MVKYLVYNNAFNNSILDLILASRLTNIYYICFYMSKLTELIMNDLSFYVYYRNLRFSSIKSENDTRERNKKSVKF